MVVIWNHAPSYETVDVRRAALRLNMRRIYGMTCSVSPE
jgi:hypothetical protein